MRLKEDKGGRERQEREKDTRERERREKRETHTDRPGLTEFLFLFHQAYIFYAVRSLFLSLCLAFTSALSPHVVSFSVYLLLMGRLFLTQSHTRSLKLYHHQAPLLSFSSLVSLLSVYCMCLTSFSLSLACGSPLRFCRSFV